MAMNLRGYLAALGEAGGAATELTHRAPLQALLEGFARARAGKGGGGGAIKVLHEPKGGGYGRPDFMVKQDERIIGYVEAKRPGADLDAVIKSEQIRKYNKMFTNIVVTDYLEFIRLENLKVVARGRLCAPAALRRGFAPAAADEKAVADVLTSFMSCEPAGIASSKALAAALSIRTHWLRDFIGERIESQKSAKKRGRLYGLYKSFQQDVFNELSISEFADAFAQMLSYGLFLAKLNANDADISISNAKWHIKSNFGLLRELLGFLDELKEEEYRAIRWLVEEITAIMNGLDLAAIREDLSFRKNPRLLREEARLFAKDPYVYFYEDFLRSYDEATRESRGVYYTPPPVVNFIVRAVNHFLRGDFKVKRGLADHNKVTVLDFATGTGTFLIEVLHEIFAALPAGKRRNVIREHVLKNIYGFEFLIAPYAIAHLKLSQFLADFGYTFERGERLQIYLTNTLEEITPKTNLFVPKLSEEVRLAQAAKKKPILVIIGNPPYSAISRNNNPWINNLIEDYKFVDGRHFRERKHWLHDDYVKFIRFAQYKMEQVEEGIVGIITNHSFLDNLTFRGMRQSLLNAFNQIYLLDLHGNSKRGETAPGGGGDQNVFDIQQGVAVSIFIKKPGLSRRVMHADLWGGRQYKYRACAEHDFGGRGGAIKWRTIKPASPDYYFKPVDKSGAAAYQKGWRIPDIFSLNSVGVTTARDNLTVHFGEGDVLKTVKDFYRLPEDEARQKYHLGRDGQTWTIAWAKRDLAKSGFNKNNVKAILYRPFDCRRTYYTGNSGGFICRPRDRVMRHMLAGDNVGLVTVRQVAEESFNHVFAGDCIADFRVTLSNRGGAYMFPLYRHEEDDAIGNGASRAENLSPAFRRFIDNLYGKKYPPEKILTYIYAVLHSPAYRKKYNAFLKRDFARVPFAGKRAEFEKLARLGDALLRAHLMRSVPASPKVSISAGAGAVVKVSYDARQKRLYIAPPKGADKGQYFSPLSPEVWEFRIGGYQVLEKYLKSRRGRVLSLDEMAHAEGIARVIAFTLAQMKKIEAAYTAIDE